MGNKNAYINKWSSSVNHHNSLKLSGSESLWLKVGYGWKFGSPWLGLFVFISMDLLHRPLNG